MEKKFMKKLRYLETLASVSLMLSKYFLAVSSIYGWWLSILGYVLTTIFNIKIKLKIVATIVAGLALLSAYGLYKWSYEIVGLQSIDFVIIGLSGIFAIVLVIREIRHKQPFWIFQSITTIAFGFAFIALGMKMEIGWYALLIGHINNIYLYYKKKAYIIGIMQVISIIIILFKLLG
ncbi:nicotinamide mononucleotide transporter family protein [Patescibacteria group bacterium]|nr:nicotinamide mononucleotide transporter family protein [Patescibacteria group bacterium]